MSYASVPCGKYFRYAPAPALGSMIRSQSSRIPFSGSWTENQIHPSQADAYLFIWYNCEEGTEEICLIPTDKMISECRLNRQHGDGCFSMGATVKNREALKKYMVPSFEALNRLV